MARKSPKKPPSQPVADTLTISDLRLRLEFLEQDNQKLIAKIEKKRTELNNLLDRMREIGVEIAERSAPVMQKLLELDGKMHAVFAELFTRKFGKQTRRNIETVYENLQILGLITPSPHGDNSEDNLFDFDEDSEAEDWEWREQQAAFEFEDEPTKLDRDELKKIRQLFLRLADVFHPDKVTDAKLRDYHTQVMQEINGAYQSGDLAKLLAIEKKHQMGELIDRDNQDDLTRRCARIEQENEFLKSQFENLKEELRQNKNTPHGSIVAEYRRLSKSGYDPIGEVIEQTESQVEAVAEVYQFVLDFRDKKMTIKDFMKGPVSFQQMYDLDEDDDDFYF